MLESKLNDYKDLIPMEGKHGSYWKHKDAERFVLWIHEDNAGIITEELIGYNEDDSFFNTKESYEEIKQLIKEATS